LGRGETGSGGTAGGVERGKRENPISQEKKKTEHHETGGKLGQLENRREGKKARHGVAHQKKRPVETGVGGARGGKKDKREAQGISKEA